tara:strand:- start:917 stop:1666 length:750 start_codon:yes stop_codon:yes gene_type:complete
VLPTAVKRVQFYSRNSHEKYVYWLIETVKIPYHESLFKTNSRNVVDELVVKMISEGKTITETTILAPIIREIEDTPLEPVIKVIEEKVAEVEPSWVESAKNAIGNVVEDVVEEIQEKVEEVVEIVESVIEDTTGISFDRPVEIVEEMMIVPEVENPFGGEVDYNSYTVRELQKECKARGITIRGTKSEVVLRLRHDDAGIVEQPTQGVTEAPSQEAADETPDTPSQEAVTEEVTTNDDSGQTELTNEEE